MKQTLKSLWLRALPLFPGFCNPLSKGRKLINQGRFTEGRDLLSSCMVPGTGTRKAWSALADAYLHLGNPEAAVLAFEQAHRCEPSHRETLLNYAHAKLIQCRADDVITILRESVEVEKNPKPHWLLTAAQAEFFLYNEKNAVDLLKRAASCDLETACQAFSLCLAYAPDNPFVRELLDILLESDIRAELLLNTLLYHQWFELVPGYCNLWREWFNKVVPCLNERKLTIEKPEDCTRALVLSGMFNQGYSDIELRKNLAEMFVQKTPELDYTSPRFLDPATIDLKQKIRLGIAVTRYDKIDFAFSLSELFGKFDKVTFELVLFGPTELVLNSNLEQLSQLASRHYRYGNSDWRELRAQVEDANIDILMHENITNPALTYLPFARLAPVQCNFMDRCQSIGATHEDYIILFGNPRHLSSWAEGGKEKLAVIRSSYWVPAPHRATPEKLTRTMLGLPEDCWVIFYPQTFHRWLAEDDVIIEALLRNNPQAYFIGIAFGGPDGNRIVYRWKKTMPDLMDRIRLLPYPQPLERFMGLVQMADLILSPMGRAQGGNSLATIFGLGQPTVAGTGTNFNSSIAEFYYECMEIDGLIAHNHGEYIKIADRLLNDLSWKAEKSAQIRQRYPALSDLRPAASELQEFLVAAHKRALAGLPPSHWHSGQFVQ